MLHRLLLLFVSTAAVLPAQQATDSTAALAAARRLAADDGRWPQAAAAFDALLRQSPGYAQAWVDRAEFERERDSTAAAERWIGRALAVQPRFAPALIARGDQRHRQDLAGARADFLAAVESDSMSAEALERVGRSYRWQNDCTSALPWFVRAYRRNPALGIVRDQIAGCTTLRQRADLLARLIAETPTPRLYEWRLSLPDSVVGPEARLRDWDGLVRLVPLAPTQAALVPRLQRARLLQRVRSGDAAAAAADTVFGLIAAQRDSLGRDGRRLMAAALLIRAEGRAYPPNYRKAIADLELAQRLVDARTLDALEPNVLQVLTSYRVEAAYYEEDAASLRALTSALLDTAQYRRLGARTASGASKRRLAQLLAIGREPRTSPPHLGWFLLLAAHAESHEDREALRTAIAGGRNALVVFGADPRTASYGAYLDDLMARLLMRDLELRTGATYFCARGRRPDQAFQVASYEERLTKQRSQLMWSDFLADGKGDWGAWVYDPAARELRVRRASGVEEVWRVSAGRLRAGSRELQPCRN